MPVRVTTGVNMRVSARITSILVTTTLLVGSIIVPVRSLGATDTGGYPWADATLVRAASYDWGYRSCQPAMQATGTCPGHTTSKIGVRYYESDPWHYDVRNCTSYVAWRVFQEFAVNIPSWGNAKDWDTAAARAGYAVDSTPAVGSIAQWESYYGHVAYVVGVNDDGSVNVEQYNKAGTGQFSRQSRVRANHYIHIADQPAVPSVSTQETPVVVAAPAAAADVAPEPVQKPKEVIPPLAPLVPVGDTVFPAQEGVAYLPALDPVSNEINVYGVEYKYTNSDKIEISKTSSDDGNTAWRQHWQTSQPVMTEVSLSFLMADANADGWLDLYILRTNGTASRKNEVIILSGAKGYTENIGNWQTSQATDATKQDYSLADYDGNGSLDLYTVKNDQGQVDIRILDGSSQFGAPLAEWHAPMPVEQANINYAVGDHDRDGRADLYVVGQEVTVLSAVTNYQQPVAVWKKQQD